MVKGDKIYYRGLGGLLDGNYPVEAFDVFPRSYDAVDGRSFYCTDPVVVHPEKIGELRMWTLRKNGRIFRERRLINIGTWPYSCVGVVLDYEHRTYRPIFVEEPLTMWDV